MQSTEDLYSLLVPLSEERLILPRASVAEVVRFSESESGETGHPWYKGTIPWHGRSIPLVSFEGLCGETAAEPGGRTRVVVVYALSPNDTLTTYGLLSEGFPQIVRVNREVILQDLSYKPDEAKPVLCKIRMINEAALIPDLERVEAALREYQSGARSGVSAEPEDPHTGLQ